MFWIAVDVRVDALRIRRRDCDADAADVRGKPVGELRPRLAAVRRFIEPAARAVRWRIDVPRRPPRLPQGCVQNVRVRGIHGQRRRAGIRIFIQNLGPGCAAVDGLEDAALLVRSVLVSERRDVRNLGIARIDDDRADLTRIFKAAMRPGLPGIVGNVHTIAVSDVRTHVRFAAADVDDVRRARSDRDGPDRADIRGVEDRFPRAPRVEGFPHAAVHRAEIEVLRLPGHAGHGQCSTAAKGPDAAPVQTR